MNRHWVAPLPEVSTAFAPWTSIDIHEAGGKPVLEDLTTLGPLTFPVKRACPGMSDSFAADALVGGAGAS